MSVATSLLENDAPSSSLASSRPATVPRASPYFVSLPVDFLFIGGASIILFLLMPLFQNGMRTAAIIQTGMWLTWVGNWPHFSATSYRLYSARERLRQYPFTAVAAPLIVLTGALGSFAFPTLVTPYFVRLFLIWSPYHYSGQTIGISLLYARRANHRPDSLERFMLSAFVYGTFIARTLGAESSIAGSTYYGVRYPGFGIPLAVAHTATWLTYGFGATFLLLLAQRSLKARQAPPLMYLLPGVTQYVWFYIAGAHEGYREFVPFFHGLQYLLIAWAMQLKENADVKGVPTTSRYVWWESARWYVWNMIGGACLFHFLPLLASTEAAVSVQFASAVVLSAVQIHHFFVDGVIWKLKSQSVVSPLLVNIPAMIQRGESEQRLPGATA